MFNPSSASWHIEWNLSLEIGQRTRAGESDYARETSCVRDGLLIKTKKKKKPQLPANPGISKHVLEVYSSESSSRGTEQSYSNFSKD